MAAPLLFSIINVHTIGIPFFAACASTTKAPSEVCQGRLDKVVYQDLLSFVHNLLFEGTLQRNLASPPLSAVAVRNVSSVCQLQQAVTSKICWC